MRTKKSIKKRTHTHAGWIGTIPWFTLPVIIITVIIRSTCKWNASMLRFIECVPKRVITSSDQSTQQPSSGDVIKRANILMQQKKNRGKNEQILLQYNIDALIISAVIAWDSFSLFFHCIRWVWPDGSHFDTLSKREVGNLYASNWFMRHKGSHMSCNRITISPGPKFVNDWISGAIGKLAIFRLRTCIYINAKHYCVNARPSCEYKRLNSSNPTYEITINRIDSIQ